MFGDDGGNHPMFIRRNMDFAATILPHLGGLDANSPVLQMSMDMLNSLAGVPASTRPGAHMVNWSDSGQGSGGNSEAAQVAGATISCSSRLEPGQPCFLWGGC